MHLTTASPSHAKAIAEIYMQAFPESVRLFFPRKPPKRLLALLELAFSVLFCWGVQGVVVQDGTQIAGYCLYTSVNSGRKVSDLAKAAFLVGQMGVRLSPWELGKLLANQSLMTVTVQKSKKVPKPQAAIVSVAVRPAYQGQGLGTLLLTHALDELKGQSVGLNVRAVNAAGRRLYASAGFREYGSRRDLLGKWLMLYREPSK